MAGGHGRGRWTVIGIALGFVLHVSPTPYRMPYYDSLIQCEPSTSPYAPCVPVTGWRIPQTPQRVVDVVTAVRRLVQGK